MSAGNKHGRVRIGVSLCLLGERVRYDGGHKRDPFLVDLFGRYVEWVPVCPEVEIGLPVPRDYLRLIEQDGETRIYAPETQTDYTARMRRFAARRIRSLVREDIAGFVFKRASPSCGLRHVPVYKNGRAAPRGRGLFAAALTRDVPALPVEEEGRLSDPRLRENFVSRVFARWRWTELLKKRVTLRTLMEFHAAHEFTLMAHSRQGMRRLGALLEGAPEGSGTPELADRYWVEFSGVMRNAPTRKNHAGTLRRMAGHLSGALDPGDRSELTDSIEAYGLGRLALIVPVTLLRHHARRLDVARLRNQVYLDPHPDALMLLNQL